MYSYTTAIIVTTVYTWTDRKLGSFLSRSRVKRRLHSNKLLVVCIPDYPPVTKYLHFPLDGQENRHLRTQILDRPQKEVREENIHLRAQVDRLQKELSNLRLQCQQPEAEDPGKSIIDGTYVMREIGTLNKVVSG